MNAKTELILEVKNVARSFGAVEIFRDLNLQVARGEFVALVGPSGCGKTTLLNLLSGHDTPSKGEIHRNGKTRMVFQSDGLLPWMTAAENIELGLRHLKSAESAAQVADLLALIGLSEVGARYPHQLSGGQRQRIEIARALAGETDILLLDEPFSALDYLTRLRLRAEFARLLFERPRTVIFVTHDIEEAAQLADRILILSKRPTRICNEIQVQAPRPRAVTDEAVIGAVKRILGEMQIDGV